MIRKLFSNNLFAFLLVVPFTLCFLSSLFSPVFVSASSSASLPSSFPLVIPDQYIDYFEDIKQNPGMSNFTGEVTIIITPLQQGGIRGLVLSVKDSYELPAIQWVRDHGVCWVGDYALFSGASTDLKNCVFDYHAFDPTVEQWGIVKWDNMQNYEVIMGYVNNGAYVQNGTDHNFYYLLTYDNSYSPSSIIDRPLSLNINVDGFYNWLIDTQKDSNFVSYFNLRSLSQYLQFYSAWGSAPQKFLIFYNIEFGDSYGDHLSNTQIISLKNLTDRLYREYLNSLKYPPSDFPARDRVGVRVDIDTNTTDNNTTLITDDSNDSVIVSILRDILRGVIAIRNQIFVTGTDILTGLDNIDFTVNVANDGGTGFSSSDIWGSGDITESENYLALTAAFMDKGVDVSAAENMQINFLDNATQQDSFTVSVVMPDQFVNGQFTEKTVTHTIDNTSKMYNTLILFRKLIAFAVVAYFAIRIRFELPHLIRGE